MGFKKQQRQKHTVTTSPEKILFLTVPGVVSNVVSLFLVTITRPTGNVDQDKQILCH